MNFAFDGRRFAACGLAIVMAATIAACAKRETPAVPLAQAVITDSARAIEAAHALLGPAAKAALDRGNALFRKSDYAGALAEYRTASKLAPQHAAPLYGINMVAKATNDTALADSAMREIRLRSGGMAGPVHAASAPQHPK